MLNESVRQRQLVLSRLNSDSVSSHRSSTEIEKEQSFSLNLESVILLENKLQRIAKNTKLLRMPAEGRSREAFETYEQQFTELVELCEDYWYILKNESFIFCTLPQRMFGK